MAKPKNELTVDMAIAILTALGCDSDPVIVITPGSNFTDHESAEVSQLNEFQFLSDPSTAAESAHTIDAARVRIEFGNGRGWVEGSLQDLIADRLRMFAAWDKIVREQKTKKARTRKEPIFGRVRPLGGAA